MLIFYISTLVLIIALIIEYTMQIHRPYGSLEIIICIQLANCAYLCSGVCLLMNLIEVLLAFKQNLTSFWRAVIRLTCICSCIVLLAGFITAETFVAEGFKPLSEK